MISLKERSAFYLRRVSMDLSTICLTREKFPPLSLGSSSKGSISEKQPSIAESVHDTFHPATEL